MSRYSQRARQLAVALTLLSAHQAHAHVILTSYAARDGRESIKEGPRCRAGSEASWVALSSDTHERQG